MLEIGVQTKNIVNDECPETGFLMIKEAGFTCADFSLNKYLINSDIYQLNINSFYNQSVEELINFFKSHKEAAMHAGIRINQMHMPYPIYLPKGGSKINDYLWNEVAVKSMRICQFLECPYIVIHGCKLASLIGSEEAEWAKTEAFIDTVAPLAKEAGITICLENLYEGLGTHLMEGPCCNAPKAIERIDRINNKYNAEVLGFCFDTGHANIVGLDMEEFITILDERLKVLHIHDNDGIRDLHQIPYTFSKTRENLSSTDWDGFLKGLQKIGFSKVLNFETAPVLNAFPDAIKKETLAFIATIGKYFVNEIEKV